MARRVTVECTECGATHRVLADRLGQSRACPKCGVQFILDEESTRSTYDLNVSPSGRSDSPAAGPDWDDEDFAPAPEPLPRSSSFDEKPTRGTPMLRRGVHRQSGRRRSGTGLPDNLFRNPAVIIGGLLVCVLLGFLLHLATRPGTTPPATEAGNPTVPARTPGTAILE